MIGCNPPLQTCSCGVSCHVSLEGDAVLSDAIAVERQLSSEKEAPLIGWPFALAYGTMNSMQHWGGEDV